MVYDPPPKALFCRVDGGRPGALYLVSGVLGVFWLYMLFSAGRRRVSGARTIDAGKILCRGGTDPLLCSTGPGLQNLAGLSVINEKRAFSRDRRSRTPSYRAFKPGSRPLLNSGLPGEAIWRPCSSLEVVYIQGRSAAGEGGMFNTTFYFHAARYGVHILTGGCIHQGSAPPPSTRGWGGPASYLLTPIQSASPQTFFGTPDSPGRLAVDRGLHHSWGSILRSCIWPPPPVVDKLRGIGIYRNFDML